MQNLKIMETTRKKKANVSNNRGGWRFNPNSEVEFPRWRSAAVPVAARWVGRAPGKCSGAGAENPRFHRGLLSAAAPRQQMDF
jgi:hypothetical protein